MIMLIGGLQKFSLLDYPGYISAIVFTQGCNFRCPFCHNPMLVWPHQVGKIKNNPSFEEGQKGRPQTISEEGLFIFLKSRIGKLDGVVITGGEPTVQADLPEFTAKIKGLDFLVKLDTNGTNPAMLAELIKRRLLNYIAMDVKAPLARYEEVVGAPADLEKIRQSVIIIKESGLPYEFRTTVVPGLVGREEIKEIGRLIGGAEKWYLQQFRSEVELVDRKFEGRDVYRRRQLEEMRRLGKKYVKECRLRGK